MPQDKLYFYAFSADKPAGSGPNKNEYTKDPSIYSQLNQIPNWRRIFSSLYDQENFIYNQMTYRSVEHALQAKKFESAGYKEIADSFALESKSDLSQTSGKEARKNRKIVLLTPEQLENWEKVAYQTKFEIYKAKYSQGVAREVLLATGDAELWNAGPRIKTMRCATTEKIRELLKGNTLEINSEK